MVNPVMYRLIPATERTLVRLPYVGPRMRSAEPGIADTKQALHDHVVVVGYGRVGHQAVRALRELGAPLLIIDLSAPTVESAEAEGLTALFGDASNSSILHHAGLDQARALVVTLPNQTATELVVTAARELAPDLAIVARAGTLDGVHRLHRLGARHVINPELEGGLEIVRHTLFELQYPMSRLQPYTDAIRRDTYQGRIDGPTPDAAPALDQLLTTVRGVDIAWHTIPSLSPFAGLSLGDTQLRRRSGASVVAIMQNGQIVANPSPATELVEGDLLGLIGTSDELAVAEHLLTDTTRAKPEPPKPMNPNR